MEEDVLLVAVEILTVLVTEALIVLEVLSVTEDVLLVIFVDEVDLLLVEDFFLSLR